MWDSYKSDFFKSYDEVTDAKRFQIFIENLKLIDERNRVDTATHGLTIFSDLSQDEFKAKYLNAQISDKGMSAGKAVVAEVPATAVETLVDWSGVLTTPVKDQGYCGSCWAFSATEQIESDAMRTLQTSYLLSPAQITQCTTAAAGCGGGWTETAYSYITKAGGIEQEKDYPYTALMYQGITGTCSAQSSKYVVGVTKYYTISGETNMANYVKATGPLSVCVDAMTWNSYTGGVMSKCGTSIDHCVQAVGVDTGASTPYWKVRNSWGTKWGESGYIRLSYGSNTCGITNDPTYVDTFLV
jgi:C1A family cysteine protease